MSVICAVMVIENDTHLLFDFCTSFYTAATFLEKWILLSASPKWFKGHTFT